MFYVYLPYRHILGLAISSTLRLQNAMPKAIKGDIQAMFPIISLRALDICLVPTLPCICRPSIFGRSARFLEKLFHARRWFRTLTSLSQLSKREGKNMLSLCHDHSGMSKAVAVSGPETVCLNAWQPLQVLVCKFTARNVWQLQRRLVAEYLPLLLVMETTECAISFLHNTQQRIKAVCATKRSTLHALQSQNH